MTGESTTDGTGETTAVKRRGRAASLAAPNACDFYRRSFSESPGGGGTHSPRVRRQPARSHSVKIRKTRTVPEFDVNSRWYCYRVRAFNLSSRGVINRGDSVRYRQTRAQTAANDQEPPAPPQAHGSPAPLLRTNAEPDLERFRVQLLGASGVGKTALSNQFSTSDHVFVKCGLPEISMGERDVTVILNSEESHLTFIDGAKPASNEQEGEGTNDSDASLVVFSVANRESFEYAQKLLQELRSKTPSKTIILVGNKSDLVRKRTVSTQEGRMLASSMGTKFIETSVGINYHVDELLVGTLAQLRLRGEGGGKTTWPSLQKASFRVRKLLHRLMGKDEPPSPCDMLHAL